MMPLTLLCILFFFTYASPAAPDTVPITGSIINESGQMQLEMNIINLNTPFIVVLTNLEEPNQRWEAVGASIDPAF